MKFLLDTNVCIELLRPSRGDRIRMRLVEMAADTAVCSIVRTELIYGALKSEKPEHNLAQVHMLLNPFPSFPYDDVASDHAADIRAAVEKMGKRIGPADLYIAAIARSRGLAVVTHNIAEFGRVPNLKVEDWQGTV